MVIAAILFLIAWKMTKNNCKEDIFDDGWFIGWFVRTLIGVFCFITIVFQVFDIIEALALPEKTLYDFIMGLMG